MPLLGKLLAGLFSWAVGILTALVGAKTAIRLTAVASLAAIYISCVLFFTSLIGPWFGMIFSTAYGSLLGLLFPPISGTVVAGLFAYYTCVAGARYVTTLTKLAIG